MSFFNFSLASTYKVQRELLCWLWMWWTFRSRRKLRIYEFDDLLLLGFIETIEDWSSLLIKLLNALIGYFANFFDLLQSIFFNACKTGWRQILLDFFGHFLYEFHFFLECSLQYIQLCDHEIKSRLERTCARTDCATVCGRKIVYMGNESMQNPVRMLPHIYA